MVQLPERERRARIWSPEMCHEILVMNDELLNCVTQYGRGLWTTRAEGHVRQCLRHPFYNSIKFSEVLNTLREVVIKPHGYTCMQKDFDGFAFCYRMGFLHLEQRQPGSEEVCYIFASPIHRRYAS